MDRFIDEQDRDIGLGLDWTRSSSSPASNYNSLLFDTRKGMSLKSAENGSASSSDPVIAAAAVASSSSTTAAASAANPNSSQQASTASPDPSILASGNGSSVQSVPSDNSQKQS